MPNQVSGNNYVARPRYRKVMSVPMVLFAWASLLFPGLVSADSTKSPVTDLDTPYSIEVEAGSSQSATPPELPIIPGQGDRDVGNWKPVVGNIGRFGLEAGWSLSGFARTLAGRFTSLDVQLLSLLALLGILTLIWNQSPGRRPRNYQSGDRETNFSHLNTASDEGVAITCDDSIATIDVDDLEAPEVFDEAESLDTSSANEAAEVEGSSGQDVDLITQAEVYLAYGRHKQAIEVLLEEYDRPDSDRFVAASHLIKAYRKMGKTSERNASLEQFIDTINRDIERFSSEEWDSLSNGLDELGQDDKCLAMQDSTSIFHPAFRRSRLNGDEGGAELKYDSGALAPLRKTLP